MMQGMDERHAVVGLLHPGQMGASIGGALVERGTTVLWASDGRSPETSARAEAAGLDDAGAVAALVEKSTVVLCICPPSAAVDVALSVAALGFGGLYVDANAVSPGTAGVIQEVIERGGARFVDGDLIGGPARPGSGTRLYLSGPDAAEVAGLFEGSDRVAAVALDGSVTAASGMKMCYAAWTKGTQALLLAIRTVARAEGVEAALLAEWSRTQPDLPGRCDFAVASAPKAWRFAGEMDEIADTFNSRGLPGGFATAASDVFTRLAAFKGATPTLDEVVDSLLDAD